VCQHLSGPGYNEYIQRIRTRLLGGVSTELRARAARQLFPYKRLPPLEKQPRTKDLDVNFIEVETHADKSNSIPRIPECGNNKLNEKKWTETEKRQLDKFLLGWARWEVDYANGFVRSARCEGTTKNISGICDACEEVGRDESLKRSIRRVGWMGVLTLWGGC